MTHETMPPAGVKRLLEEDSAGVYVDVRSVEEFDQGHVPGSYNIPILFRTAGGMQPNPAFVGIVKRHFARDTRIVFGCRSGGRSERACDLLAAEGYGRLVNMAGGFHGATDQLGRTIEAGWSACGFETTRSTLPGRSWSELAK
jgi:rhodanese-related sulfurtransferase